MHPAEAKGAAMMLLQSLENENQITRKIVAALPDSQLEFKLGDKGRTAKELAWHLVTSEAWFANGILNGQFAMEGEPAAPQTVAEMVAWYDQNVPAQREKIKALSGEHLAQPVQFFTFNMPCVVYLGFWNSHSIHHRGQLSTYLRAMNAHVPSIYGGSADEPFEMPAKA